MGIRLLEIGPSGQPLPASGKCIDKHGFGAGLRRPDFATKAAS